MRLVAFLSSLALIGGWAVSSAAAPARFEVANGVDARPSSGIVGSDFDPAFLVSDNVFYDGAALDAQGVQAFLDSKVAHCEPGLTCLKDYRQDTQTRPGDAMCERYLGSTQESAARIVAKVGAACGISQKALLVLLQKEQSLVDATAPTPGDYRYATGYACPDTADCDATYAGFYNQVYWAAWQFKRYANPPGTEAFFDWIPVGVPHDIQFNPDAGCGASTVTVANQATAALYYYTPYQPNPLVRETGRDEACGAYGNLNFWRLYGEWFGSPTAGEGPRGALESVSVVRDRLVATGWVVDPTSLVSSATVRVVVTAPNGRSTTTDVSASGAGAEPSGLPLAGRYHALRTAIPLEQTGLHRACFWALPLDVSDAVATDLGCAVVMALVPDAR